MKLKRYRYVIQINSMVLDSYYYHKNLPTDHNYILGVPASWSGYQPEGFELMVDVEIKQVYFIPKSLDSLPAAVLVDLYYYD